MITYTVGKTTTVNVRQFNFPAGEVGVDINAGTPNFPYDGPPTPIRVNAHIASSDDLMALMLTVDALRREYIGVPLELYLPYVPYARQDRVVNAGESLSVAVLAKMINSCGFISVTILDPHSSVTPALIDNVRVVTQNVIFGRIRSKPWDQWFIVAPDEGAMKKAYEFAQTRGAKGVITASKTRDLHTGKITGMRLLNGFESVEGENLFVLDDICDGGRTFIELAGLLDKFEPAKLELAVTHGIFSKGFGVVGDHYSKVYTTDSFPQELNDSFDGKLTVIRL